MGGVGGILHDAVGFAGASCKENVQDGWERGTDDLCSRVHCPLEGLAGSGILKPRCLDFTSAPARFPRLRRRLECLNRNAAPPTKMSSKTSECSNVGKRLSGVLFLMSKSSFLVKLIGKSLLKTGQTNKNRKSTKEQQTEAAMCGAIMFEEDVIYVILHHHVLFFICFGNVLSSLVYGHM